MSLRDVRPCPLPDSSPEEIYGRLHTDETEWREAYWFLCWGETLDNLSKYAYLDSGDELVMLFAFWRVDPGGVFVARIKADEFTATVREAADWLTTT